MNQFRRCSRPGCGQLAVATFTYAYAQSTAFIGPLKSNNDPHSWDLCEHHAARITAPLGWELLRVDDFEEDEELTALAEAVREGGSSQSGLVDRKERLLRTDKEPGEPLVSKPRRIGDKSAKQREAEAKKPAKRDHREGYVPNHPIRRPAFKAARRAHLTVVPDVEESEEE